MATYLGRVVWSLGVGGPSPRLLGGSELVFVVVVTTLGILVRTVGSVLGSVQVGI